MERTLFSEGGFVVTTEWIRTGFHDVRTSEVAAISMGRPVFAVACLAAGVAGVVFAMRGILFEHEIAAALALCALAVALSWRTGWMTLKSEALKSEPTRIVGEWGRLQRMRAAIRDAQAARGAKGGA
jgi:hypothetical protein